MASASGAGTEPAFSNPYVAWFPRETARLEMFAALETNDAEAFREHALAYGVTYVLVLDEQQEAIDAVAATFVEKVFSSGQGAIYRVLP